MKSSEFRYSSSTRQVSQSYAPPDLSVGRPPRECYICGSPTHKAKQCKQRKSESSSDSKNITDSKKTKTPIGTVRSVNQPAQSNNPIDFLESDSDGSVSMVRIQDCGSQLRKIQVDVAGVPAAGLVDTGADITIMGPELFKKVAAVAGLKKKQFKPADKVPHTYNCRQFKLDGRLDLDVSCVDKTMQTGI